jgi:hypothetical protein
LKAAVIAIGVGRWLGGRRPVTFERKRIWYIVEQVLRQDPVLPRDVIGHVVDSGCEGVMSPDAHLVDDEEGREWRMVILDVNGNGLAVEIPKARFISVVDEYEFLHLFLVNLGPKQR